MFKDKNHYCDFLKEAVELAIIYLRAAYQLYRAPRLDDDLRKAFRDIVVNADLGVPLEAHILQTATNNYPRLVSLVDALWSRWAARDTIPRLNSVARVRTSITAKSSSFTSRTPWSGSILGSTRTFFRILVILILLHYLDGTHQFFLCTGVFEQANHIFDHLTNF